MKLREFIDRFGTDEACRAHLEAVRWPDGPVCPHCGAVDRATVVRGRRPGLYRCASCTRQFTVTIGTAMEGTRLPLSTWYLAMYLMLSSSKGVSAKKLGEQLGLQYRTAWHLAHRIRAMLASGEQAPLAGIVEADETYVGGKPRNDRLGAPERRRGRGTTKPMLFAVVERGGEARMAVVPSASAVALDPLMFGWVDRVAILMTDELATYRWFGSKMAKHLFVNHGRREYARREGAVTAHTNTIEGFFGLFKRAIAGVWHHLSAKHLHRYGAEHSYRWSTRGANMDDRIARALLGQHGRLRLSALLA